MFNKHYVIESHLQDALIDTARYDGLTISDVKDQQKISSNGDMIVNKIFDQKKIMFSSGTTSNFQYDIASYVSTVQYIM